MTTPKQAEREVVTGSATCEDGVGQCYVKFFYVGKGDYRVVYTDYETVSVVLSCKPGLFLKGSSINVWILTRETQLTQEQLDLAMNAIK
mmetsp:Transcript_24524/g.18601  ORF Transcript_24524/g.18601 Transcript_24524/m.18601 type:complete len:89 (+) Transcript_24524:221-487(+)|eukprot:CAMPEP_0202958362 /NCGR_PEP_ID=MMETSP1396-20130829/2724_1 /ASSEMBLY_ACC=CAM_ASM_000872 /TAXON_ID= /ORGANISM="Pseudokeronopsis sp., Strain Brazil" /LENGTH=88 /DNA_ID=CAMNT_0049676407 /DNA_START=227 /DNA_END=493 /DNA_ORIENTATION=-